MSESLEQELKSTNAHSPKITKENMVSWLTDKPKNNYRDWIKKTQNPLQQLGKIAASLKQLGEAEFELKDYLSSSLIPFIVQALNLAAKALEEQVKVSNDMLAYTLTQHILLSAEKLFKNNPTKLFKFQKADLTPIMVNLNKQLRQDAASSALPINTNIFFSLIHYLHKYNLLLSRDIPKLMFEASKLFKTARFSTAKLNKHVENLGKVPGLTSPQASDGLKALANFAECGLLKLPLNNQLVTLLMTALLAPGRQKIDPASPQALIRLQKTGAFDLQNWDVSPFNHYLCAQPDKPLQATTKTLLTIMTIASHFCREISHTKAGSVKKIGMIGIESAWDNFLENSDFTPIDGAKWIISTGHVIQADHPAGSSAKLQAKTAELLRGLNTPSKAESVSIAQIANIFYGSLLLGVVDKVLTHHLYDAFQRKVKIELTKKKMNSEQIDKFVNQVAQYASHCGYAPSVEMKASIKKRMPEVDKTSFQHKLIAHVRTLSWFKNSQEVEEEKLKHDLWATDGYVKLKGKPQRYIVEVDSRRIHEVRTSQDRRRDKFLLTQKPEEAGTELLGIIRIPVGKNTTINSAAAVWKEGYEDLIKKWELTQRAKQSSSKVAPAEEQKTRSPREDRKESSRTQEFYGRQKIIPKEVKTVVVAKKTEPVPHKEKQKHLSDPVLPLTAELTTHEKKRAYDKDEVQDENQHPNVLKTKSQSNGLDFAFSVLDNFQLVNEIEQEKAFLIFLEASTSKSPDILNALGQCYEDGIGVSRNHKSAFLCYQSAMEQKSAEGYYNLGRCYEEGIGVQQDPKMSVRLYSFAINRLPSAQNKMGEFYQQGIYLPKDLGIAYELFQEAAGKNYPPAQYNLAKLYFYGAEPMVQQNPSKAVAIFQEIVDEYPPAYVELGRCFEEGVGVKKNVSMAFECYQQAATECFDPVAQYELGRCYICGIGHHEDMNSGLESLNKAAKNGFQKAQKYINKVVDVLLNQKVDLELVQLYGNTESKKRANAYIQLARSEDQKIRSVVHKGSVSLSDIIERRRESPMLSEATRNKQAVKKEESVVRQRKMTDLRTTR